MKTLNGILVAVTMLAWSSIAFCGEIHDAAARGDVEKVKTLLRANPELANDKSGWQNFPNWTPLNVAAYWGMSDVVRELLAHKADVNLSAGAETPLHCAIGWLAAQMPGSRDRTGTVKVLLANGADVNAKGAYGGTPLHYAIRIGEKECVELLLSKGADPNSKDQHGSTPLHEAAYLGRKDIIELLLKHKADLDLKDDRGRTPSDVVNEKLNQLLKDPGIHKTVVEKFKEALDVLRLHAPKK